MPFSLWNLLSTQSLFVNNSEWVNSLIQTSHEFRHSQNCLNHQQLHHFWPSHSRKHTPICKNLRQVLATPRHNGFLWTIVFPSLIPALSSMGRPLTSVVRKNTVPAALAGSQRSNWKEWTWLDPHLVCSVLFKQGMDLNSFFVFLFSFYNCAEVMILTTNPLKLKHTASAHMFMTTVEMPQKRWTSCDCFY